MADIRKTNVAALVLIYAVAILFTVLVVYPVFWLIIQSFKTTKEYMSASKLAFPAA